MNIFDFLKEYPKYKSTVSLWTVKNIHQNIALPLTYLCYKLKVKPNSVTFSSFCTFLIGGYFFYQSNYYLSAFLWLLSYALDCTDGALARFTNSGSRFGAFFDVVVDRVVSTIFLALICIKSLDIGNEPYMPILGAVAIVAYAMVSSIRPLYFPELKGFARSRKSKFVKWAKIPYEALDTGNMLVIISVSFALSLQVFVMGFYFLLCVLLTIYNLKIIYEKFG
ncbi:TPA: CDP-alcohol phosphatidyltransferase family protein [Vibrio parahaemolyticus]